MPQETNLNVSPYFDDYQEPIVGGKDNNYYKVLFKPGYPVQARELTTLQSILQNQVEQFGNHFFREGARVIPGAISYINPFNYVQIEEDFLGIPVGLYVDNLIGKRIRGEISGIVGVVKKVISNEESERGNYTLYVDLIDSDSTNFRNSLFSDGENLIVEESISFEDTFISANEAFARTISLRSSGSGNAFAIGSGVYFLRGHFVNVDDEIIILDQYATNSSYKLGLDIIEDVINSDLDENLNDNSNGFNNYASPGADRLKITTKLAKKPIDSFDNPSFVELARVINGFLVKINSNETNNNLNSELARRTFDESGNYYVKSFNVFAKESLNDEEGNNGIYFDNQLTFSGERPSDDLMVYKISPGKAYVQGYEVQTTNSSILDVPKTRTTKFIENQSVNFNFGSTLVLNNTYGSPNLGINSTSTISLRDRRVGINSNVPSGKEIGIARVYDFALEGGSYEVENLRTNLWDISLYDIQTYGDLVVNEPISLTIPTYIRGNSSGATAFLKNAVSVGTSLTVYQISGSFINGEKIIFDGITETRVCNKFTNYSISDVKSLFSSPGIGNTFSADIRQNTSRIIGEATISGSSSGISTITIPLASFPGIVTTGNLIQYNRPGFTTKTFSIIEQVFTNSVVISGITTVPGICDGGLPTETLTVGNLELLTSNLQPTRRPIESSLFEPLSKSNIQSVDLTNSNIVIRRQFDVTISNNSTNTIQSGRDEVFLPFDEERYVLIRNDGVTEVLSDDRFIFSAGSNQLTINGLGSNATGKLIATLRKSKVSAKYKKKSRVNTIILDKSKYSYSGTGSGTLNDGLDYGNYPYGTRVQDEQICLNVPDVLRVYGVFESKNENDPFLPKISLGALDGPTAKSDDLIIGEPFIGTISRSKAMLVEKVNSSEITFVYLNSNTFEIGEIVRFKESNVNGIISNLMLGSNSISDYFVFDNGQKLTHYDYSSLIRLPNKKEPSRKIKIVYSNAFYDSSDTGDITLSNSYESFDYRKDIVSIGGIRNTDIIDVRPRVNNYAVIEGARSPFEFDGRRFDDGNHSSDYVFASDESETFSFSYYLPRIDRIYLSKNGVLQVKYGSPSDTPQIPEEVSGSLNIANIAIPPYVYNIRDIKIDSIEHKRYQMNDIFRLENRIKNLEYYTSLSLLESSTSNLFISDSSGQNRFKSGFFIDNFSSTGTQDNSIGVKNSLDLSNGQLRPSHYTTQLSLQVGSNSIIGVGTTNSQNQDQRFIRDIIGTNVKKTGSVLTLDYNETLWLEQPFATRVENVTPFLVQLWQGNIKLEPDTDVWIDVNRFEVRNVEMEGSFLGVAEALRAEVTTSADGSRLGISPIIWQSWETTGINQDIRLDLDASLNTTTRTSTSPIGPANTVNISQSEVVGTRFPNGHGVHSVNTNTAITTQEVRTNVTQRTDLRIDGAVSLTTNLDQRRTGERRTVREEINTESLGDRIVSRSIINFQRSRNIEFNASRLKPNTQVYGFFDEIDVNRFCTPKLLEISMTSGTFLVGESVFGVSPSSQLIASSDRSNSISPAFIAFRVASSNHKYGPFNQPSTIYVNNPYDRDNVVPALYSPSSSILNIDTFSLQDDKQPEYSGYIVPGMILRGQTSGAQAIVTSNRLVTDFQGVLLGSFFVPTGSNSGDPIFETGRSVFRITNSPTNSKIPGVISTVAEEMFYSQGDIDNTQEVTLSLRNARTSFQDFTQNRTLSSFTSDTATARASTETSFAITSTRVNVQQSTVDVYRDPLAQSFKVGDFTGVFITKIDIFFRTKDSIIPVDFYISEVKLGVPTQTILPFSNVTVYPDQILTSEDSSIPTTIQLDSPVYLESEKEYALVLLSDSTEYTVWISRLGEFDVQTISNQSTQVLVSQQPLLGSLFKSQNASTWDASQYEDLKFRIYRADFTQSGSSLFFNPTLPTNVSTLTVNPLIIESKSVKIGIGTTVNDSNLRLGNTIRQSISNATGILIDTSGSITGNLTIINSGIGYTPSNGSFTFNNIPLINVESSGKDASANITISDGVAIAATISNGGRGYLVGDSLTVSSIGISSVGRNLRLGISELSGINELILNNVQGDFAVGTGYTIRYTANSGITTDLNGVNGNVIITSPIETLKDGLHIKVLHRNHGMHSDVNLVEIENVKSDVIPSTLTDNYLNSSTSNIQISDVSEFTTFEGVSVGSTNPGYALISNEIIKYTGISGNSLTGITRGIDSTNSYSYNTGSLVYKYELNGVSLLRINKTHSLSDATVGRPIELDSYNLKINMSSSSNTTERKTGITLPKLFFNQNSKVGGSEVKASYNVTFDLITPNFATISPKFTTISSAVRTVSGKSIDGNESPFLDKGFQSISLSGTNYFDSPRIIASNVNESARLPFLPGNKSFTMNINLLSSDSRLSPCIDLSRTSIVFTTNRINEPIQNYKDDPRANQYLTDPNAFVYVSRPIQLKNPATAIKLLVSASIHESNDIRAFYSLQNDASENPIFIPFPGYGNLSSTGIKLDQSNNDGLPDALVSKNSIYEFLPTPESFIEYEFTDDNLPNFKIFRIKFVLTSTNQSYPPIIKDIRAIGLA